MPVDHTDPSTDVVDAVLLASRVLVGVAAESLAEVADRITLPQYRTLVILASRGPLGLGALAEHLAVHPSTATRQCDRLVAAELIRRTVGHDRRAVTLAVTPAGRQVVDEVTAARRAAIAKILTGMSTAQRQQVVTALHAFAAAADEIPPEQAWTLGWST